MTLKGRFQGRHTVAVGTVLCLAMPLAAQADPVADFYRGKTVTVAHTGGTGGTFAVYSRFLVKHLPDYIPGKPTMVLQFMPGGGGINGMNYLQNAAPRDGTFLVMPSPGVELAPFLYPDRVKFRPTELNWIGNLTHAQSFVTFWHTAPVQTWEEAKQTEVIIGATGKGSETYLTPMLMNALLGTKFRIIAGYPGITEVTAAMEQGEVHGRGGGWTGGRGSHFFEPPARARIVVQVGAVKLSQPWRGGHDISDVPLLRDLADNEEDRQILNLQSRVLARGLVAPPDVPEERVAALRDAFDRMINDPKFLDDLAGRNLDLVEPMNGPETEAYVRSIEELPERVKTRYRDLISQ